MVTQAAADAVARQHSALSWLVRAQHAPAIRVQRMLLMGVPPATYLIHCIISYIMYSVRLCKLAIWVYKVLNGLPPQYLADDCQLITATCRRRIRSSNVATCDDLRTRTSLGNRSFTVAGPCICNSPPVHCPQPLDQRSLGPRPADVRIRGWARGWSWKNSLTNFALYIYILRGESSIFDPSCLWGVLVLKRSSVSEICDMLWEPIFLIIEFRQLLYVNPNSDYYIVWIHHRPPYGNIFLNFSKHTKSLAISTTDKRLRIWHK